MKRIFFNLFRKLYTASIVLGACSTIAVIVLEAYAFFAYNDSFFTTSPNYIHLEKAAPMLYNSSIVLFVVSAVSLFVGYASYKACKALKKRR